MAPVGGMSHLLGLAGVLFFIGVPGLLARRNALTQMSMGSNCG